MLGLSLALLLLTCGATAALAQQPSKAQTDAIRQSCRADYQSHCADVPTGGKEALACLQQNAASLSPGVSARGGGGRRRRCRCKAGALGGAIAGRARTGSGAGEGGAGARGLRHGLP